MRGPRIPYKALIASVLSGAVVVAIAAVRPTPEPSSDKDWFWRYKTEWRQAARIVLAGNSRAYRGLDPGTIEQAARFGPALNFGFSGQVWTSDYLDAVERTLMVASGGVVVLAVDGPSLRRHHVRRQGGPPRDGYEQAAARSREAKMPALWEARLENALQPLQPITLFRTGELRQPRKRARQNQYLQEWNLNGWIASDYTRRDPGRYLRDYWKRRSADTQRIDQETMDRLLGRIATWRARGIHVFAFRIPTTPETDGFEDKVFGYDDFGVESAFRQVGAHWITIRERNKLVSYDGSHLARESAVDLSRQVGEAIAATLQPAGKAP